MKSIVIFIQLASFHPLFSATRSNSKIQKALLGQVICAFEHLRRLQEAAPAKSTRESLICRAESVRHPVRHEGGL